ncbi:hypothetical protein WME99_36050 [Sorangium sp. So ce136]|uniref:hypothetical protein n=1 Tax=Sorangium sp. So ce136 TaxID=3133284 RepID=UPI003EFFF226
MHCVIGSRAVARGNAAEQARALARDVEVYEAARAVGDTEKGEELAREIVILERLIRAYEDGALLEQAR